MRVLPLLLSACFLAALSGCSSTPPPTAPSVEARETTSSAPAPAAALAADPTPANGTAAVHMEGETPAGACVFAPFTAQCQFQGGRDSFRELEASGLLLRVSGTLQWNATLPAGDPATLEVYVLHDDGAGWTFSQGDPYAAGPSPLAFDLPLLTLHGKVGLSVTQSAGVPLAVGYAAAMLPHPFVLDGGLAYQAAAGTNPS